MTDTIDGDNHYASQRAKYERVLATFARIKAARFDAPSDGDGDAAYLATYSELIHGWFATSAATGHRRRTASEWNFRDEPAARLGPRKY